MATTPIIPTLRAGGALKCSPRTNRFFIVQNSRDISIDQAEARKLASTGALRPNGIDSHGNYVFALNARTSEAAR
jgi:hypothetical protein